MTGVRVSPALPCATIPTGRENRLKPDTVSVQIRGGVPILLKSDTLFRWWPGAYPYSEAQRLRVNAAKHGRVANSWARCEWYNRQFQKLLLERDCEFKSRRAYQALLSQNSVIQSP